MRTSGPRSGRQALYRARYDAYMESEAWHDRRRTWCLEERRRSVDGQIHCAVCGAVWGSGDQLHHLTYERLGHERHEDLVPLCRHDHRRVEQAFVSDRFWRTMPDRSVAMRSIMARLRAAPRKGFDRGHDQSH